MTETLSIRLDTEVKKRLDALASLSKRGLADLDRGHAVSHEKAAKWLRSWGKPAEGKAPR
jgi:predicted transcriptional regulator